VETTGIELNQADPANSSMANDFRRKCLRYPKNAERPADHHGDMMEAGR